MSESAYNLTPTPVHRFHPTLSFQFKRRYHQLIEDAHRVVALRTFAQHLDQKTLDRWHLDPLPVELLGFRFFVALSVFSEACM